MRSHAVGCAVLLAAFSGSSCRNEASSVALSMALPQGSLDEATSVELLVFPAAGAKCESSGEAKPIPEEPSTFKLRSSGCDAGVKFCSDITLERDDSTQMFFVRATNASGLVAQGCATAVIDRDPIEVSIKMVQFVAPACCGDGIVDSTEQCDPGGSDSCEGVGATTTCNADCTSRPVRIDEHGSGAEDRGQDALSMTFAPGVKDLSGGLRLVYQFDGEHSDIGYRLLKEDLTQVTDPSAYQDAHKLFVRCTGSDVRPGNQQRAPVIVPQGEGALIAYISNEKVPTRFDAVVWPSDKQGCNINVLQGVVVSDQNNDVTNLDAAKGPGGRSLVVFEEAGDILGREVTVTADGVTLSEEIVVIADSATAPRVSGSSDGWVVAYQADGAGDNDGGVFFRRVGSGLTVSSAVRVNAVTNGVQDQADVAVAADSFAVVFRSGGKIWVQRYDGSDAPIGTDQDDPVVPESGAFPQVEANGSGDFFAIAFEQDDTIVGRFLSTDGGYLLNNVSGQNDAFTIASGNGVSKPTVTTGEGVIFGWTDLSAAEPGIYVRAFPLPR